MKKLILSLLTGGLLTAAHAQLINQQSVGGTLFGALVGSAIGSSVHGQTWEGAAIGAGAGFVLGNLAYGSQQRSAYAYGAPVAYSAYPTYSYAAEPAPQVSYAYPYPASTYTPASPVSSTPKYAIGGTLLGALVGGVIGNSVHHQGWEGAGIGAASGLLLGSLADRNARIQRQKVPPPIVITQTRTVPNAPVAPAAPVYQPENSMSSANSLFGR